MFLSPVCLFFIVLISWLYDVRTHFRKPGFFMSPAAPKKVVFGISGIETAPSILYTYLKIESGIGAIGHPKPPPAAAETFKR